MTKINKMPVGTAMSALSRGNLEIKDDNGGAANEGELSVKFDKIVAAFEDLKTANADALQQKAKGLVTEEVKDAVTAAEQALNEAISQKQEESDKKFADIVVRIDGIEAKGKRNVVESDGEKKAQDDMLTFYRQATGDFKIDEKSEKIDADGFESYKSAFLSNYLRHSENNPVSPESLKAMQIGGDPRGGYLVPATLSPNRVTKEFDTSPIRQIASVITISTDRLEMIVDRGRNNHGWVGETGSRPETATPEIGMCEIKVNEIYSNPFASQNMIDDAAFDVGSWLQEKANQDFMLTENQAFVAGSGASKPRGYITYAGDAVESASYSDTDTSGHFEYVKSGVANNISANGLIDVVYALKPQYRAGAVFTMKRSTLAAVRKLQDSDGHFYWQPSFQQGQPGTLLGYPVIEAEDMPSIAANAFPVAFGNFARGYQIVDRQGTRLLVDPYSSKPYVSFYMTRRVGGDVIDFEAIKLLKCEV